MGKINFNSSHHFYVLTFNTILAMLTFLLCFSLLSVYAQIREEGNSENNNVSPESDVVNWIQAPDYAAFTRRCHHTSVVFNNKMWVIGGGEDLYPHLKNDVWYSSDGVIWTQATASAAFPVRWGHTSVVYNNKMWVVGGYYYEYSGSPYLLNDVWYSTDGVVWTQTASATFPAREYHTSVVFNNKMWVIGGYRYSSGVIYRNDVWYSKDGVIWTQATASAAFPGRYGHTSVVYKNKMWVIGGYYNDGNRHDLNDVWYSTDGVNWTLATASAAFPARNGHTSVVFNNKMWVNGEYYDGNNWINDVWYSTDGVVWTQATASTAFPFRNGHTSVVYNNKMWVIGGINIAITLNDVWYSTYASGLNIIAITSPDSTASEIGGDVGTLRISRDGSISSNLTVYFTISGTATNGADYNTITSPVTIPAGQFYKDITVTPIDDSLIEGNEDVVLTLSSSIYYNIGYPNSAKVTIIDNDKPSVTVDAIDFTASEPGTDKGILRISRTGSTNSYLDVQFKISGTAINGTDYNLITIPKTIQKGQQYVDLTVTPKDETVVEEDETVILTLLSNNAYNIGSPGSGTVTIQDNDSGLRVISPNGGEVWEKNKTYEIKWAPGSNTGTMARITLWSGGSLYTTIVSDTENDGSFLWTISSSIPTASDYRVRITSLSNQSIYDLSDNYFSITTKVDLSSKIVSKREFISKLENLYQVNYLAGLIVLPLINKYNENQAKNLMNQWESQIPNSQDSQRSLTLERGILAEKGIKYAFNRGVNEDSNNPSEIKGALVMAKDTIGPFCECISLMVPLGSLWKGVNQYVNSNPDLPQFIKDFMVGVTRIMFEFALDLARVALDSANAIQPIPFYDEIKSTIDLVKDYVLRGLDRAIGLDILLYIVEPIGVYGLMEYGYVPKTQPYLTNGINNLSGLNYSGDFTNAQTKVNQVLDNIKNETKTRDDTYQITKVVVGFANIVLDLVSIVGVVSAGTITAVAQALKVISVSAFAIEGVGNGWYLFVDMPDYVNNISTASFHPDQVTLSGTFAGMPIKKLTYSPQNNMIKIELLSELKESTQSYNNLVQQVLTAINNDDLNALETLLPQLLSKDKELGGSFKNSLAPLLGVSANANSSDPDFKTNYEITCDSLLLNNAERLHFYGLIVEYLLSTQGKSSRKLEDVKSDIQNQGSITTNAVNYAEQKINYAFDQTSSVQSSPVVAIIYNDVQATYECNNKYDVTTTIKNVGAGQAQGVTATLDFNPEEDFYYLTDKTVTIGNLEEGEERIVEWQFGIYTTSSKSKLVAFTFGTDTTNGLGTQLAKGSEVTNSTTNVINNYWSLY